jgi:hypothetical protein
MPMFGANCVNARLPRVRALDPRAVLKTATGNRFHGNTPDWDLSRAHDTGWQAWLNPGHPAWRDELAGQIEALSGRFYVLRFAHLCEGEPEGRTGVHELGRFRAGTVAAESGLLATIAFQDGTLERSRASRWRRRSARSPQRIATPSGDESSAQLDGSIRPQEQQRT